MQPSRQNLATIRAYAMLGVGVLILLAYLLSR
jgi:hypothetical protein